jgi:hypothetical protein
LIDALFLEIKPSQLVASALKSQAKSSWHIEHFIRTLFYNDPTVRLPRSDLFVLLAFLLHDAYPIAVRLSGLDAGSSQVVHLDAVAHLFRMIAERQRKLYEEFVMTQDMKDRDFLLSFVPEKPPVEFMKEDQNDDGSRENALRAVMKELDRGNNANMFKLACCMERVTFGCKKRRLKMFMRFVRLLASLTEEKVQESGQFIERVCFAHFRSRKYMTLFNMKNATPEFISGMARFLWHCDMRILENGDGYYPVLYDLFQKSKGDQRHDIILICLAINRVTGKSILDLPELAKPHANLIARVLEQFTVEPDM